MCSKDAEGLERELKEILQDYTSKLNEIPQGFTKVLDREFDLLKELASKVFDKAEGREFVEWEWVEDTYLKLEHTFDEERLMANATMGSFFNLHHQKNVDRFLNSLKGYSSFEEGKVPLETFYREVKDMMRLTCRDFSQALLRFYHKKLSEEVMWD